MKKEAVVYAQGIEKSFGSHKVLKGVSLEAYRGSVFALLGANGAGKTTFINLLTTLTKADAGTAFVAGFDVSQQPEMVRESITVTGQQVTVDGVLTGYENLVLVAKLHHMPHPQKVAQELLEQFDLTEAGGKAAATYSGGMKRRLDIALSLIGNPEVIFLDEPTTGLDPAARREVWDTIAKLAQSGITIFLTTQYMEEAEHLADTIAVLHEGHIIANGDKEAILSAAGDAHNLEEAFLALTSSEGAAASQTPLKDSAQPSQNSQVVNIPVPAKRTRRLHLFGDTWTLTVRMLKHNIRSMDTVMTVVGMPLLILLLFVFVLGGAMDTGSTSYINYVVPAVLLVCIASGVSYTAFRVNADILSGIFDRLRTMPIARSAFVGGHVLSSVIVNGISCLALFLIALLIGYRPGADIAGWGIALGLLLFALIAFATIGVAFGIMAKSSEGSGMFSYLLIGLMFVSSGFAPTSTMPPALQIFADVQPMTPIINSLRNALLGQSVDAQIAAAIGWLLVLTVAFSLLSINRINRLRQ